MKSIHNILTVAKYESKTLFRSWFFRIFSILSLLFVLLFNLGTQTSIGWPNGEMVALPSMVPFINLYIINIAQAIIAVFLASDFLKRDKKLDTTEVIYMRSMTNADYVLGKTMGNIWVFFVLNFIALGMVAIFNFSSSYTQFSPAPYIYYFFLISLPTLVFILGFSFFLMSIIKNQAVTFVILLGYIAATLFYLQNIYHNLFDYMAFHLPMAFSDFVGFAALNDILVHRMIYLFLGLGFIGLTIVLLQRLPQSTAVRKSTMVFSAIFLLLGVFNAYKYIANINREDNRRDAMLTLNDQYAKTPIVRIDRCSIELDHQGDKLSAKAELDLSNPNPDPMSEVILTLNPGLDVSSVDGASFTRELQLIKIKPSAPLVKGATLKVTVHYAGKIDEAFCYLDLTPERMKIQQDKGSGLADRKLAFLTNDYVLLTPETKWYPTAGISFSSQGLNWYAMQFVDFHLTVKTKNGLKAISQGAVKDSGNGTFEFSPEGKMPQMSLAIGHYTSRKIDVDGVEYGLNTLEGHNAYLKYFKVVSDSLKPVIRDLRKSWETKVRFVYPYKRFNLVEVPVQFNGFTHVWTGATEQVQPEIVYLPEGGYKVSAANFAEAKKQSERWAGHDNQTVSPRETEESYFRRFVNETLLTSKNTQFGNRGGGIRIGPSSPAESFNPYFIFPNYYTYISCVRSEKYPIINRVMESYLSKAATETGNPFMRNFSGVSSGEQGNIALQEASFSEILSSSDDQDVIDNVIVTKSGFLFTLMKGAAESEKFDDYLRGFVEQHRFESYPIDSLNSFLKSTFQVDLNQYLPNWYTSKSLPGYIITKVNAVRFKQDDKVKSMVTFQITNAEPVAGAVSVSFRLGGGGMRGGGGGFRMRGGSEDAIEKTVLIDAKTTKRVTYVLNREPRSMTINTFASHNIPSSINTMFGKVDMDDRLTATNSEEVLPYSEGVEPNEIILDNEDKGFVVTKPKSQSLIQKLLVSSEESTAQPRKTGLKASLLKNIRGKKEMKYKGMVFWNPPVDWTLTTSDQFYGKMIRSAYYLKGGTGDRTATWNVPIKENGYYKVSAYIPKIRGGFGRDERTEDEYNFTIYHDDGKESQVVNTKDSDGGWMEIGTYHFSPDTAKIVLSNQSKARTIIADAIKLVREK